MTQDQNPEEIQKRRFKLWWIPVFFLIVILISIVGATTFINRPGGAQWVSSQISNALGTEVSLRGIHLNWKGQLSGRDFLIKDHRNDTLIYAGAFSTNISSLYAPSSNKKLNLGKVYLERGEFNVRRYRGDSLNNLIMTFQKPNPNPVQEVKEPFSMNLSRLTVKNFTFRNDDEVEGTFQTFQIENGDFKVNELDLEENEIDLKFAHLNALSVDIDIDSSLYLMGLVERPVQIKEPDNDQIQFDSAQAPKPFVLKIEDIAIANSNLQLDNNVKSPNWTGQYHRVNYDHLLLEDMHVEAQDFVMRELDFSAVNAHIAFNSPSGFELQGLDADFVGVNDREAFLHGLVLQTPNSYLRDTIEFKYREYQDWKDFNNSVFIRADFKQSVLALRDIMHFAPNLYDNTFFINAENQQLEINGLVNGRINSLKGRDLSLYLGDEISFRGDISTRDLAVPQQQFFGARIDNLTFDILSLEKLIPNLNLPENFQKLQDVQYRGRFDGYPLDFVTFGKVRSALGSADLDMRLDLKNGRESATYSGKMNLKEFDLGTWSGNSDLGALSLSLQVKEGTGLSLENAEVSAEGSVQKFSFKEHTYENMVVNGSLSKSAFDGFLKSNSDDANFVFNGIIKGLDSVPTYRFTADVNQIRLKELNLAKETFDFGGRMQVAFTGLNWKELIGSGAVQDFWMIHRQNDTLELDSVYISQIENQGARKLIFQSQSGGGQLEGVYDIPTLHKDLLSILAKSHPKLSDKLNLPEYPSRDSFRYDYTLDLHIDDPFNIVSYFTRDKFQIEQVDLTASLNTVNQSIRLNATSPKWRWGNVEVNQTNISLLEENQLMIYKWTTSDVAINNKSFFLDVVSEGNLRGDQGEVSLNYEDPNKIFRDINLNAEIEPYADELGISLDPAYFTYSNETWRFLPGNEIRLGKKKIFLDDFVLSSFRQVLKVDDYNDGKGIRAEMSEFSTDLLDSLITLKGFDFSGSFSAALGIDDVYTMEGIDFELKQDKLFINDKNEGSLSVTLKGPSMEKGLDLNLDLSDGKKAILAEGTIATKGYKIDVELERYPLVTLENIITSGMSQTKGNVTGKLVVEGVKNNFDITGSLEATGSAKVDYIGVVYSFDQQQVKFTPGKLDFTGAILQDEYGNSGRVDGYLSHNSFRDWGMNLSINTQRLLMLETGPQDNPNYYGTAFASGQVQFYGSFENPGIYVQADSRRGTNMVIPISYGGAAAQSDFVQFVQKDTINRSDSSDFSIEGLEMELKLGISENAKVKIIFDEQAGDILQGSGRGNMVVKLARNGELSVYGDYEIDQGDYLFTLLNFVNKPFVVRQGSRIRWTGDPIDAQINLSAEYKDLTASPYPLIQDFAVGNDDLSDAQRATRVDLTMNLRGSLLRPLIDFEIQLPELIGEVKTYAENQLQIIRTDQNRLNRQVFGLVVLGTFLPTEGGPGVNGIGNSTVNTLSEFLSTQLSFFVSGLLNNVVDDVSFISGVDVDLAYIQRYDLESESNSFSDGEYQFRVRNRLWNDRWVVTLGGNYGNQSISAGDPYFNPETVIEWNTPIRGLKLRAYYRGEDSIQGQRQLVGGGIRYRKEFDSFGEFFKAMRKTNQGSL